MSALSLFFRELGGISIFIWSVHLTWFKNFRRTLPLIIEQISLIGSRSLLTILFAGFFVGAILVIQFRLMLVKYDALALLGGLNTSGTVREIGPMIISFLLAGKVGAFTAAELGTMNVTEQIDAVRCLGKNPIEYLIVPRFVAIVFSSLLLLIFGLMVGVVGSMTISCVIYKMNFLQYIQSVPRFTDGWTIFSGLFKSLSYGFIVAAVCTYKGYHASGGARGVGVAVTQTAIFTNLYIVFANSFTTYLVDSIHLFSNSMFGGYSF